MTAPAHLSALTTTETQYLIGLTHLHDPSEYVALSRRLTRTLNAAARHLGEDEVIAVPLDVAADYYTVQVGHLRDFLRGTPAARRGIAAVSDQQAQLLEQLWLDLDGPVGSTVTLNGGMLEALHRALTFAFGYEWPAQAATLFNDHAQLGYVTTAKLRIVQALLTGADAAFAHSVGLHSRLMHVARQMAQADQEPAAPAPAEPEPAESEPADLTLADPDVDGVDECCFAKGEVGSVPTAAPVARLSLHHGEYTGTLMPTTRVRLVVEADVVSEYAESYVRHVAAPLAYDLHEELRANTGVTDCGRSALIDLRVQVLD